MRILTRLAAAAFVQTAFVLTVPALPALAQDAAAPEVRRIAFDETFGDRGPVRRLAWVRRNFDVFDDVAIDSQGRIVVSGQKHVRTKARPPEFSWQPRVARFLPDGRPDGAFGDRGVALLPVRRQGGTISIDAQDRILVVGNFENEFGVPQGAVRLRADGTLDTDFSKNGMVEILYGTYWSGGRIGPDGETLFAITKRERPTPMIAFVTRLRPDGTQELSYGSGGIADTGFSSSSRLAVDAQGRTIVAGILGFATQVRRFDADGKRDLTFGTGGLLPGVDGAALSPNHIRLDAQGRILAIVHPANPDRGLWRYLPDGAIDTSFADGGRLPWVDVLPGTAQSTGNSYIDVARDAPDRMVIAGSFNAYDENPRRRSVNGIFVQAFDAAEPGRLGFVVQRSRPVDGAGVPRSLDSVAIEPDGAGAIVVGSTYENRGGRAFIRPQIERVDLTLREAPRLPDVVPAFAGEMTVLDAPQGTRFRADVFFTNRGEGAFRGGGVDFYLSVDETLDATDVPLFSSRTPQLPAGATRRRGLLSPAVDLHERDLTGLFVLAVVPNAELHETSTANNVAVSAPLR